VCTWIGSSGSQHPSATVGVTSHFTPLLCKFLDGIPRFVAVGARFLFINLGTLRKGREAGRNNQGVGQIYIGDPGAGGQICAGVKRCSDSLPLTPVPFPARPML